MILSDRVKEITTSESTGPITLGGAAPGFRSFNDVCADGDVVPYCIAAQEPGEWEVGYGTYASGELTRTTVLSSSNAGAAVDFAAGLKDVFLTCPADLLSSAPLREAHGVLTAAQVLDLFATPVVVLADAPGITLIPRFLFIRKPAGTPYTLNGSGFLYMNYGQAGGTIHGFKVTAPDTFDQADEKKTQWLGPSGDVMNVGFTGAAPISGLGLRWLVPTANWTLGDSDLHWSMHYHRLTEV